MVILFFCDQHVILLNAEPRLLVCASIENFLSMDMDVIVGLFENLVSSVGPLEGVILDEDVLSTEDKSLKIASGRMMISEIWVLA